MNHCVPNFQEMEDDYSIPTPSGFSRPKKLATTGEEEIMELLWQNGQVVVQSQNQQRPPKRNALGGGDVVIPSEKDIRSGGQEQHHLFMQEDEMSSWLQYPLDDSSFDRDLYSDLLFPAPPPPNPINTVAQPRAVAEIRPPPPPITKPDNPPRLQNFMHFSRPPNKPSAETTNKPWATTGMESTVVESNETPAVAPESSFSHRVADSRLKVNVESGTEAAGGELGAGTCEVSVTSSPGGSRASFSASEGLQQRPQAASGERERKRKRKRKDREGDDSEYQSEDIEFEAAAEAKKQGRGSASTKRSRATEVHNLSERRRRDRINEKMRALQDLIPRCNKSDKASMLDEAIEYLKSLQVQVQMMSMGCGMVPMMYPGMQQYMPAMGMGMGMGIGMNVGMNRPMVPYPSMLPGSAMPSAAAAHMGSRFPMPAFQHMQPVPLPPDPTRIPASNQTDPNPITSHGQNQTQIPNFIDPYQQFIGLRRSQLPLPQNQAVNKPQSTGKDIGGNHNNQQS